MIRDYRGEFHYGSTPNSLFVRTRQKNQKKKNWCHSKFGNRIEDEQSKAKQTHTGTEDFFKLASKEEHKNDRGDFPHSAT
jgi:hypothetical protein